MCERQVLRSLLIYLKGETSTVIVSNEKEKTTITIRRPRRLVSIRILIEDERFSKETVASMFDAMPRNLVVSPMNSTRNRYVAHLYYSLTVGQRWNVADCDEYSSMWVLTTMHVDRYRRWFYLVAR
jgi:hypothetical protein